MSLGVCRMKRFRLIVAGGRDFTNYPVAEKVLDSLLRAKVTDHEIVIVCGMARGADALGEHYAKSRGYRIDAKPANWTKFGKSAGYRRNEEMAQNADACLAFWDFTSKGTKHMIDLSKQYGLALKVYNYQGFDTT